MNATVRSSLLSVLLVVLILGLPSVKLHAREDNPTGQAPSELTHKAPQIKAGQENVTNWTSELTIPLVKLIVVATIFAGLIWWLELPRYLKDAAWNERTFLAMSLILTFCAAAFVNVGDESMKLLKDVVLVVVGFYFGSTRSDNKQDKPYATSANNGEKLEQSGRPDSSGTSEMGKI